MARLRTHNTRARSRHLKPWRYSSAKAALRTMWRLERFQRTPPYEAAMATALLTTHIDLPGETPESWAARHGYAATHPPRSFAAFQQQILDRAAKNLGFTRRERERLGRRGKRRLPLS